MLFFGCEERTTAILAERLFYASSRFYRRKAKFLLIFGAVQTYCLKK